MKPYLRFGWRVQAWISCFITVYLLVAFLRMAGACRRPGQLLRRGLLVGCLLTCLWCCHTETTIADQTKPVADYHHRAGSPHSDRLVGLVIKASTLRTEDPVFESRLQLDLFPGWSHTVIYKLALQWLPCQAPGVTESALGLVVPASVYCDWMR